jgi:hypothetical protein
MRRVAWGVKSSEEMVVREAHQMLETEVSK